MTNDEISELFENPHFQTCMFDFISAKLQIRVKVEAGESRINVSVDLEGQRIHSFRYDYLIGDSNGSSLL